MGNDVCDLGYHFMLFIISSQVQNCRRYSLESQTSGDNQWCFFYRNENSRTVWSYFSFNFGQTFTFCYLRLIFLFNDAKVQNLLPLSKFSQMFKVWYFFARSEFWFITTTQKWLSAIILKVGRLSTEMKQKNKFSGWGPLKRTGCLVEKQVNCTLSVLPLNALWFLGWSIGCSMLRQFVIAYYLKHVNFQRLVR